MRPPQPRGLPSRQELQEAKEILQSRQTPILELEASLSGLGSRRPKCINFGVHIYAVFTFFGNVKTKFFSRRNVTSLLQNTRNLVRKGVLDKALKLAKHDAGQQDGSKI